MGFPNNQHKMWTVEDMKSMRKMVKENTPTRIMALKLGRTAPAVQQMASEMGLSLKPVNQRPYNRLKK